MLEPRRIEMDVQPDLIEKLGNGTYYYNYDIKSKEVNVTDPETEDVTKETRWTYIQVHLRGVPECTACIQAIIREYISTEEELALINKYSAYQMGIITDSSICSEYQEYCGLVTTIKANVKKDFSVDVPEVASELIPTTSDMINLLKVLITTTTLTDAQALACKSLYPTWESCIGKALNVGDKVTYKGALCKVKQKVSSVLENQAPGIATAALYEEINETHAGTKEDPIPYNNNMELKLGKYYSQDGVIYLCSRDTGQAVYNPLKDLVGIYVTVIE